MSVTSLVLLARGWALKLELFLRADARCSQGSTFLVPGTQQPPSIVFDRVSYIARFAWTFTAVHGVLCGTATGFHGSQGNVAPPVV